MSFDVNAETARWLATMTPEQMQRAIDYTHGSHWLILGNLVVTIVIAWVILRLGMLTRLRDRLNSGCLGLT